MFAACFDERNVTAKNKSKVEKIRLFLERWEGHNQDEDEAIVCQQREARGTDRDVCGKEMVIYQLKSRNLRLPAVCGAGTFPDPQGFWLKVAHC